MKSPFFAWILVSISISISAADWNQWRGPLRDGRSDTRGLLKALPDSFNTLWTVDVGEGQSSPILYEATVYMFAREGGKEVLSALELSTGKVLWKSGYEVAYEEYPGAASFGKGPKSTPVYADGKVFTLGVTGILSSFDAKDGRLRWQKEFQKRFPETYPPFGSSMSPIVVNGLLIAHVGGHDGGALIAWDTATGEEKWNWSGQGPSYSSPVLWKANGGAQLVLQVHRKIIGIDPANGKLAWEFPFVTPCDQNVPTPLVLDDGQLVVWGLNGNGFEALKRYQLDVTDTWAHPVPAGSGLLVKDRKSLSYLG